MVARAPVTEMHAREGGTALWLHTDSPAVTKSGVPDFMPNDTISLRISSTNYFNDKLG